jgi:hypothetical protein
VEEVFAKHEHNGMHYEETNSHTLNTKKITSHEREASRSVGQDSLHNSTIISIFIVDSSTHLGVISYPSAYFHMYSLNHPYYIYIIIMMMYCAPCVNSFLSSWGDEENPSTNMNCLQDFIQLCLYKVL